MLPRGQAVRITFGAVLGFGVLFLLALTLMKHGPQRHAFNWEVQMLSSRLDGMIASLSAYWERWLLAGLLGAGATALLWCALARHRFVNRVVGQATPISLGVMRSLVCLALLQHVLYEPLESVALIPEEFRSFNRLGFMACLEQLPVNVAAFVQNPTMLLSFRWLTGIVLALAMVGLFTRITMPVGVLLYMIFAGILREFSYFWHMGLIGMTVMGVAAFTPCGDAFSLDRLIRRRRGQPRSLSPSVRYGCARWRIWLTLAVLYTMTGISKLANSGFAWCHADNLRAILFQNSLEKHELGLGWALGMTGLPDALFTSLGIVTIAAECLYFLVLFSRTARIILPAVMLSIHVAILLLMDVLFIDAMICQLLFIDFDCLQARARALWSRRRRNKPGSADVSATSRPSGSHHTGPSSCASAAERPVRPPKGSCMPVWIRPVAAWGISAALICGWLFQIEAFPCSSLQMFSGCNDTGCIKYYKLYLLFADGTSRRTYLDETIGALHNLRCRPQLEAAFDPTRVEKVQRYYTAVLEAFNRKCGDGPKAVGIEIQKWMWPFASDPDDAQHGQMIDHAYFGPDDAMPRGTEEIRVPDLEKHI